MNLDVEHFENLDQKFHVRKEVLQIYDLSRARVMCETFASAITCSVAQELIVNRTCGAWPATKLHRIVQEFLEYARANWGLNKLIEVSQLLDFSQLIQNGFRRPEYKARFPFG